MTDISVSNTSKTSGGSSKLIIVFAVLVVVGLAAYAFTRPPALDTSVLGLRGFAAVAEQKNDLKVRFLDGNTRYNKDDYGLRILPLYAPGFSIRNTGTKPKSDENEVMRSLPGYVFRSKIQSLPTLVVMPKWREGVLVREVLHPDLLMDTGNLNFSFLELKKLGSPEVRRDEAELKKLFVKRTDNRTFRDVSFPKTVSLYAAQTLSEGSNQKANCVPAVEADGRVLLASCSRPRPFWLLMDPDVINNHGAGKGENYEFALSIVKGLAKGKPVLVDGTIRVLTTRVQASNERSRSFSDLARFFAYPFSLVWGGFAVLAFFGLWHAWRRVGPLEDREEGSAMLASKVTAIEANVAILRGHGGRASRDVPLAATYVEQRLQQLALDVLGAAANTSAHKRSRFEPLFAALARRNDPLANRLRESSAALTGTHQTSQNLSPPLPSGRSEQSLFAALGTFETTLEEARHEFGRIASTR